MYGSIYKATNILDGKCYIGQTTQPVLNRIKMHINESKRKPRTYFQCALKSYGYENFAWEVIDKSNNIDELSCKEQEWIKFHESNNHEYGYNLTNGGENIFKFNEFCNEKRAKSNKEYNKNKFLKEYSIDEIIKFLKENYSFLDCSKKFNITYGRLKNFIRNNYFDLFILCKQKNKEIKFKKLSKILKNKDCSKRKIQAPIQEVIKYLNEGLTFKEISEKININSGIIKARLKDYDKDFYNKTIKNQIKIRNIRNGNTKNNKRNTENFKYKIEDNIKNEIIKEFTAGLSLKKLSNKFLLPSYTINSRLKAWGLK
jgi:hypothetical protein